jgi:hypothetical protein
VFKDKEPRKAKNVAEWEKNKMIETVNGGDSLIDSKNPHPWRDGTQLGRVCQILLLWTHKNLRK